MQIRVANRQDEKQIQSIFAELCSKRSEELDLNSKHQDLRNIEANYFGSEGIFLVAEIDGSIIGFAGAKKVGDTVISIDRFYINDAHKRNGIDLQFMQVILPFAQRMFYEKIKWNVIEEPPKIGVSSSSPSPSPSQHSPASPAQSTSKAAGAGGISCFNKALLVRMRFKKDQHNIYWLNVEPSKEPSIIATN